MSGKLPVLNKEIGSEICPAIGTKFLLLTEKGFRHCKFMGHMKLKGRTDEARELGEEKGSEPERNGLLLLLLEMEVALLREERHGEERKNGGGKEGKKRSNMVTIPLWYSTISDRTATLHMTSVIISMPFALCQQSLNY